MLKLFKKLLGIDRLERENEELKRKLEERQLAARAQRLAHHVDLRGVAEARRDHDWRNRWHVHGGDERIAAGRRSPDRRCSRQGGGGPWGRGGQKHRRRAHGRVLPAGQPARQRAANIPALCPRPPLGQDDTRVPQHAK